MMRTSVEKLRLGLVVVAGLLICVVAGFLIYAHHRAAIFTKNLPGKMGANITREANGYTWSQTVEGRTVFTLHAAKLEQRKDGQYTLHDVGIVLYGRKQDRTDRIYGKQFEYDQTKGVVRGIGEVHMDLQAPASGSATGEHKEKSVSDDAMVHVLTSGLVYLEKLGVAATSEDIEFSQKEMKGWAHGADYNADSGVLVLQSAVRMNGLTKSGPMVLTASRAEWNHGLGKLDLNDAKTVTTAQTIATAHALIDLTQAGQPQRMVAEGRVVMTRAEGGELHAEKADVAFGPTGKAKDAVFGGGVTYVDDEDLKHEKAQSDAARVTFDGAGQAERVVLTGSAGLDVRERGSASAAWNERTVNGQTVDVALGPVAGKEDRREIRDAVATGNARVVGTTEASAKAGATRTEMSGDDLKAHFVAGNRVQHVVGTGHTVLHQVNAEGVDETSVGESTDLVFRPVASVKGKAPAKTGGLEAGAEELVSAVQVGHVSTVRKHVKAGAVVEERATADRANFDADTDRVTLTGGVQMSNVSDTLWGAKVVVVRGTGDATAEGGVRVNYIQMGKDGKPQVAKDGSESEPIHVTADHAELKRGAGAVKGAKSADDVAFFYGVAGRPARLWEGSSQVQAPVLKFEEAVKRLTANGGPGAVHTVLVGSGASAGAGASGSAAKKDKGPSVVRVASSELVYSDASREAVFSGGVVVEDADGRMKSAKATAYLTPAGAKKAEAKADSSASLRNDKQEGLRNDNEKEPGNNKQGAGNGKSGNQAFLGGSVERVLAQGKVEIDQPGKHGTGEELVYTASDQMYVLTGTKETPPKMVDEMRGTATGESIRFHAGDDSVVVTGESVEKGKAAGRRTETRIKQ